MGKNVLRGNDEKLHDLVGRLDKMTVSESRLVGAETLTEGKRTGRKVEDISVTLTETSIAVVEGNVMIGEVTVGVQQMTLKQDDFRNEVREELGNMMAALNESRAEADESKDKKHIDKAKAILQPSVSPVDTYASIDKTRVPGTGDWIRKEDLFQAWMNQDNPVLWVSGNPGSGKSYLSGNMISFLGQQYPQGVQHASHISIGYFFFKNNDPRTRSFKQALNDLAYQISQNDPIYAKYIDSNFQSASEIDTIQSKWRRLFVDYFIKNDKVDSKVYLVLDGVDEALESERQTFLELLVDLKEATLSSSRSSSIHLVMVGRPQIIDDINEALQGSIPTIHVDWRKNNQDIIDYVKASIKKSKVLRATKKDLQEEIVETLAEKANGMFMWCDLMMRELSKKSRPSSIRESLHHAPKGLQKMLRHVLEGFSSSLREEDPDDLNLILMWVTCVATPLSLGALDTILKLKSPEGDGVLFLEGKLRKQFASFFTLAREDGLSTADLQAEKDLSGSNDKVDRTEDEEGLDDVENDTDFDSNPLSTTVAFCHASLGDFFRDKNEGKARSGDEEPEIGVNIVEAKVGVLKTCLSLICDPELSNKIKDSPSMLLYSQLNWHTHLTEMAEVLNDVDPADKRDVGNLLLKMLHDEAIVPTWSGQRNCEFFTSENLQPIRAVLEHAEVLDALSDVDRQWVESTKSNPAELFLPTARVFATKWLQAVFWTPTSCMLCIRTILNLVRGHVDDDIPKPAEAVPISVILDAAEWPAFEKTAQWHRRLAMCLRGYKYYNEAIEHFQIALDMDPGMWLARGGIATTFAAQKKYKKAIELQKLNDSIIEGLLAGEPKPKEGDTNWCDITSRGMANTNIADHYKAMGDTENALKHYKLAFEFQNLTYVLAYNCIEMLSDEPRSDDIISLLKEMDDKVPGKDWTRLTAMIWQYSWWDEPFFKTCSAAAHDAKELLWMVEVYKTAAAVARKDRHPVLATALDVCISELYTAADYEQEDVARIWDRVLKLPTNPGTMENWQIKYCKDYVVGYYGVYCLKKAREHKHGTPAEMEWVRKLEGLCKAKKKATDDAPEVVTTNYSATYLGMWYLENGYHDKANACFQPFIKEALMMLSDDDPNNDMEGLSQLASVLTAAGDDDNAVAVFQSLRPKLPKKDEDGGSSSDNGSDDHEDEKDALDSCNWLWGCDGPCHRSFSILSEANKCRRCLSDICDDCVKLIKSGDEKAKKICSAEHTWLHVGAPELEVEENQILVGGKAIPFEEFKERLRVKWKV